MIPHMSLPISTTTAGELLKSLTFYNDIKCLQLMDSQSFMWGQFNMSHDEY